jgi:hypothetical protein
MAPPFEDSDGFCDGHDGPWDNNRGTGKNTYNCCQGHYTSESDTEDRADKIIGGSESAQEEFIPAFRGDYVEKNRCARCGTEVEDLNPGYIKRHFQTCRRKFTL